MNSMQSVLKCFYHLSESWYLHNCCEFDFQWQPLWLPIWPPRLMFSNNCFDEL